jgi:hypothetical protein
VQAIYLVGRRRVNTEAAAPDGRVLRIRAYSIFGGVDVHTPHR